MRSARSLLTIAVEDMASAPPSAKPVCQGKPSSQASAVGANTVSSTCPIPRPNTTRRMLNSLGRLNSSPIENIRNTTPNSAR